MVDVRWLPVPNFKPGRTQPIKYIILHYTEYGTDEETIAHFSDPARESSSHYLICYNGEIVQFVREADTAWHAGKSAWQDDVNLNPCSIGIEISNGGEPNGCPPYAAVQYNALGHLLTALLKRHDLKPEAVLGHSDIAPDRKIDPGKHFNWRWLEQHGLAAPYVPPTGLKSTTPPLEILAKLGYRATPTDAGVPPASPEAIVAAFQRRYFPEAPVLGKLCPRTEYFIRQGKRK